MTCLIPFLCPISLDETNIRTSIFCSDGLSSTYIKNDAFYINLLEVFHYLAFCLKYTIIKNAKKLRSRNEKTECPISRHCHEKAMRRCVKCDTISKRICRTTTTSTWRNISARVLLRMPRNSTPATRNLLRMRNNLSPTAP